MYATFHYMKRSSSPACLEPLEATSHERPSQGTAAKGGGRELAHRAEQSAKTQQKEDVFG